LLLAFYLKNQSTLKNKSNVLHAGRTKTMTKIKAEGTAWGVSKRAMHAGKVEFCLRGNIFHFSFI